MKPHLMRYLSAILIFLTLSSCDLPIVPVMEDPSLDCDDAAGFSTNIPDGGACNIPCNVVITNTSSTRAKSFFWDFNRFQGDTATLEDPETLVYNQIGNYTITLLVKCENGESSRTVSRSFSVVDPTVPPVADFEIGNNNCFAPCTLTFTNKSTNFDSSAWYINGLLFSTENNPPPLPVNKEMDHVPVKLKVFNGGIRDSVTNVLDIGVHTFEDQDPLYGSGKAIFQMEDHGYLIVGNTGQLSGKIYLYRIGANGDTGSGSGFSIEVDFESPVQVEDAIRLSDGSFALIGHADDDPLDGKFRIVYYHFKEDGVALHGPLFITEEVSALDNRDVFAVGLDELTNSDLIIIGTAVDGADQDIYFKVIGPDLTPNNPPKLFSAPSSDTYLPGDVEVIGSNIFVSGSVIGTSTESFLLASDKFGNLLTGFPKPVTNGLSSIQSMAYAPVANKLFFAGINSDLEVYLGQIPSAGLGNGSILSTFLTGGFATDLSISMEEDIALVSGRDINKKAAFAAMNTQGQLLIDPPVMFGGAGNNRFNSGLVTSDSGFAFCGHLSAPQTLYFVKTDQNGIVDP